MAFKLDAKIPAGALAEKWSNHKAAIKVVSPANKRKLDIIIVGTGLGGASAAASLGELGYNVKIFCIQDSPRRAHSIAAQGGINAAKNYQNDNDSVYRLFYDTIKGGDYRAREANVYRLAEVSNLIIDQCVAQGVPFAREYGGLLANRSFGGAQVSRTFYARGQTGQQLLLGAYSVLNKEIAAGTVKSYPRHEMLDIVIEDGEAKGIIARNLVTGEIERHGRIRQRILPFDQRHGIERFGCIPVLPQGRRLRQPLLHANPPDLHPRTRRSAVEADAHVGVAAQRRPYLGSQETRRREGHPLGCQETVGHRRGRPRLLPGAPLSGLR